MAFLFGGGRPSGVDALRDFQRQVLSSGRSTDREVAKLNVTERTILRDLRKCGAENNLELARVKAREMIRLRAHRARLFTLKSNMTGLAAQLGQMHSSAKVTETIARTTRMLQSLNSRMDAAAVTQMLAEFERQNDLLGNKQEVINDTLDGAFETDGEAAATDEALLAVFQEAGVDAALSLARTGQAARTGAAQPACDEEDMQARLQRLR